MSKEIEGGVTILSTSAADVAQGAAVWHNVEGATQVAFRIELTGTATLSIDVALDSAKTDFITFNYTASDNVVLDDAAYAVRAYSSGIGGGESGVIVMYRIFSSHT